MGTDSTSRKILPASVHMYSEIGFLRELIRPYASVARSLRFPLPFGLLVVDNVHMLAEGVFGEP